MDKDTITVRLPRALVEQLRDAALLDEDALAELLREALRQKQTAQARLFAMMFYSVTIEPHVSPEEVSADVEAYRAERHTERSQNPPASE